MGHVKKVIERMNKKVQPITSAPQQQPINLPGFHRAGRLKAEDLRAQKAEYNLSLKRFRAGNKKLKALKGDEKKDQKKSLDATDAHMKQLLTKIGTYTDEEKVYGFKEVRDAK